MNLKNLSIILALLSFELKVFTIPIHDSASEKGLSSLEISESEISTEELSNLEISESEVVADDLTTVGVVDSESDSDSDTDDDNDDDTDNDDDDTDNESDTDNDSDNDSGTDTEEETTEVPTDSMDDLPCSDVQDCIGWIKQTNDTEVIKTGFTSDVLDYILSQYQEEKIEKFKQEFEAIDYGMKVDVNGHEMTVDIKGEEHDTTIVVLPGLTLINPVMFYKNITELLANDYKVVTIEPLGYGISDLTDEERTVENIVSEIHECLQELEIDQFYFMGHSIGGIYSLVYDNTYEDEVLGFIGLDNTPNNKDFDRISYSDSLVTVFKIFDKYHLWGLLPDKDLKEVSQVSLQEQFQKYSEKEMKDLMSILRYRLYNPSLVNEFNHGNDNRLSTSDKYFHCPLLMFLADHKEKVWKPLHENMIDRIPDEDIVKKSKIVPLEGTNHVFIHSLEKDAIYEEIKQWIN